VLVITNHVFFVNNLVQEIVSAERNLLSLHLLMVGTLENMFSSFYQARQQRRHGILVSLFSFLHL